MHFSQRLNTMADMLRHSTSEVTEDPQGAVKLLFPATNLGTPNFLFRTATT